MSKPTVTRIVDTLCDSGIVHEIGVVETSLGRKPIQVALNPNAFFTIGVNITLESIHITLVNVGMEVIDSCEVSMHAIGTVDTFQDKIAEAIMGIIAKNGIEKSKMLGVGIGSPGLVNHKKGIIGDFGIRHTLYDIPIKSFLEQNTGFAVVVDNNANTRMVAEYWGGYGKEYSHSIYVICSKGVGSGSIIAGNILRGRNDVSGEFGHMTINVDGRKCICGKYGCIESYCSLEAFEEITREALRLGKRSHVVELMEGDIEKVDYHAICRCAEENDPFCKERLEITAHLFGIGLANLVGIINPEIVIMSGELFDDSEYFYNCVVETVQKSIECVLPRDITFKKRNMDDVLYRIGAAALVLKELFDK